MTKNFHANAVAKLESRLNVNKTSYKYDITEIQNVLGRDMKYLRRWGTLQESVVLKIKHLIDMVTKEITKLDKFCLGI